MQTQEIRIVTGHEQNHRAESKESTRQQLPYEPITFYNTSFEESGKKRANHLCNAPRWRFLFIFTIAVVDVISMLIAVVGVLLVNREAYTTIERYMPVWAFIVLYCIVWLTCLVWRGTYHRHIMAEGYELYVEVLNATIATIVVFCFIVFVAHRIPKVSTVSRVVMPVLAAMLVFLPFLSERYNLVFSMLLLGSYYFVALLITYLIAEAAQTRKVSPYVLMGVAMGVARVCLAVTLLSGYAAGVAGGGPGDEAEHTMRYLVIIVVVLYALCMALVFFSRDRKRRRAEEASADAPNESAVGTDSVSVPEIDSTLDACCASVAREGGLTEREAEILVYLARGRTKAYIADALFVTENTVRSHVRNIYSKLDVHTRQELLDLLER